MNKPRIISDYSILGGKPIIEGTRISVALIVGLFASGMTHKEILEDYPTLSKEAIQEALSFASQQLEKETMYPVITHNNGTLEFPVL